MASRIEDPLGAFCAHSRPVLAGSGEGPLTDRTFAVKDVFHIAGYKTGFGSPEWLATHEPATATASAVGLLLDVGAEMVGKTLTDELAYSLTGENVHYGTPVNPAAPDRVPGGSSNGSASAVAGGLVDFALGTDCGGSVRLPASYCGIFGIRPTVDRVPLDGVIPFGPALRRRRLVRARRGTARIRRPGFARRHRAPVRAAAPAARRRCVRGRRGPRCHGARRCRRPGRGRGGAGHRCLPRRGQAWPLVRDLPGRAGGVDLVPISASG